MTCEIKTRIDAILSAYSALCSRCCPSGDCTSRLPSNVSTMCGDGTGLLREIYAAVVSLITATGSCSSMTESVSRPASPDSQGCITDAWLLAIVAWIEGVSCGEEDCPSATCYTMTTGTPCSSASYTLLGEPYSCHYTDGEETITWDAGLGRWIAYPASVHEAYPNYIWTGPATQNNPIGEWNRPPPETWPSGYTPCSIIISLCVTPEFELVTIQYEWAFTGQVDLDTGTSFYGATAGYACGCSGGACNAYMTYVSGDVTGRDGAEVVTVDVDKARADGVWVSSTTIQCCAGWYQPAGGSGTCLLRVTYKGVESIKTVSPGSQAGCATSPAGTITVYDNGTFLLE